MLECGQKWMGVMGSMPKNDDQDDHKNNKPNNDQHKPQDLALKRRKPFTGATRQFGNPAENSLVSCVAHNSNATAADTMGSLQRDIAGFKIVWVVGVYGGCERS